MAGLLLPLENQTRSPIEEGINSYYQAKQLAQEKARQQMLDQAMLTERGLISNGQGGYSLDPAHQAMQQANLQNLQNQNQEFQEGLLLKHVQRNPDGTMTLDPTGQKLLAQDQKLKQSEIAKNYGQANLFNQNAGSGGGPSKMQLANYEKLTSQLEQTRGQPAAKQAETDLYNIAKVQSLAQLYKDPNNMSPQLVQLLTNEVGKIAAGGSSTEAELDHLTPQTLASRFAGVWQQLSNNPTPANASAFVKQYVDYVTPLQQDAKNVIQDRYGRMIEAQKSNITPSQYDTVKNLYVNRFLGPTPGAPSNGPITAGGGGTDEHASALQMANQRLAANPNDPIAQRAKAMAIQNMPQQSAAPSTSPVGRNPQSVGGATGVMSGLQSPTANPVLQSQLLGQDPTNAVLQQRMMQQQQQGQSGYPNGQ